MDNTDRLEVTPELHYRDPAAALAWLAQAFGFETRILITDSDGTVVFAETEFGGQPVAIAPERQGVNASPLTAGTSSQTIRIRMTTDVDAHCARARNAGAQILSEPELYFFGDKTYLARDLEGHVWSFGQRIAGAGGPPPSRWNIHIPKRRKAAEE